LLVGVSIVIGMPRKWTSHGRRGIIGGMERTKAVGPADVFVRRIGDQIADLRLEEERLRQQEEVLKAQGADVRKRISDLMLALDVYRREMGLLAPESVIEDDDLSGSWSDLSYYVMSRRGGRMKVAELVDELARRQGSGDLPGRSEATYATVYSSLRRDARFKSLGDGAFEIRAPSDEEVLRAVAEDQRDREFAGLKKIADQHGWHNKLAELIDRGLLIRYQVPNRNSGDRPVSALRVDPESPAALAVFDADMLRLLRDKAGATAKPA